MKASITFELRQSVPKQSQPLQRIYGIHRALERKMSVKAFEQNDGLIDDNGSFPFAQISDAGEELIQADGFLKERPDCLMGFSQNSSGN
jgi:hypothetical protein